MAITDLAPVVQYTESEVPSATRDTLGRSDFLRMFIEQMRHQDPLNPMEGTDFTAQLAQFSSLEQLFNISESSNQLLEAEQEVGRMEALKLIGKEVEAEGNALVLPENSTVQGAFTLPEAVTQCTVSIYDGSGTLVRTLDLGALTAGEGRFSWDGLSASGETMPPGIYAYQLLGKNINGNVVQVETRTSGVVTGVRLQGSVPTLSLGTLDLPLTQVTLVREPAAAPVEGAASVETSTR